MCLFIQGNCPGDREETGTVKVLTCSTLTWLFIEKKRVVNAKPVLFFHLYCFCFEARNVRSVRFRGHFAGPRNLEFYFAQQIILGGDEEFLIMNLNPEIACSI